MKRGGNSMSLPDCSRRQKRCAGSVNGICDLPDSILGHILSFLPTENAVATHILSQRWKFLWTMTNNLSFSCPYGDRQKDLFVKFVNRVLLFHKPGYLNRVSLEWLTTTIPDDLNAWISVVVLRNVHELSVLVPHAKLPIHVQRIIFSCESLHSLVLDCRMCIFSEIAVSLPRLETLKLISISFQSEKTLCNLLGGCPVLKYLFMEIDFIKTVEYCQLDRDNGIEFKCIISSNSLIHLEVDSSGYSRNTISAPICSVQVDAPFLKYLKLRGISSFCIHQSLTFLVEANICLNSLKPDFENQSYFDSVAKAFRSFDRVKKLTISPQVIWALTRATIKMKTMFNKLTSLEVTRVRNWGSLREFLTCADCLEDLTLNTDMDSSNAVDFGSKSGIVPKCLLKSLRTVCINDYDDDDDDDDGEIAMVGYILRHGRVLELMEIRLDDEDIFRKYDVVKKISELPRKSPVCKVSFRDGLIFSDGLV